MRYAATALKWAKRIAGLLIALVALQVAFLVWVQVAKPRVFVAWNGIPGDAPIDSAGLAALQKATQVPRWPAREQVRKPILDACAARQLPLDGIIRRERTDAILCRFLVDDDTTEINSYLRQARPDRVPGSTWFMAKGDWDFGEITMTELLFLTGEQPTRMHAKTLSHLLDQLLVERGGEPSLLIPESDVTYDTENHLLMRNVTLYLKNHWERSHGRADTQDSTLERWLVGYLNYIRLHGFDEFNSIPYETYGLKPILLLEAFAPAHVAALARTILDDKSYRFALGSLGFRQCTPFRRQYRHRHERRLTVSRMAGHLLTWHGRIDKHGNIEWPGDHDFRSSLEAAILPYRPPVATMELVLGKSRHYFARIGHGEDGSPEIHSGGPGYLLSAGGVYRGLYHKVMPRPTALLLDDGAPSLDEVFHIEGGDYDERNNTGVHHRFAVGNSPVHVPAGMKAVRAHGPFQVFQAKGEHPLAIVIHSADDLGLIALFVDRAAEDALAAVLQKNPDAAALRQSFRWPDGRVITYDVDAPPEQWVIASVDDKPVDRDHDSWPLLRVEHL